MNNIWIDPINEDQYEDEYNNEGSISLINWNDSRYNQLQEENREVATTRTDNGD